MITTISLILSYILLAIISVSIFNIIKNIILRLKNYRTKLILTNSEIHQTTSHHYFISGYDQNHQYRTNLEVKGFPLVTREKDGSQTIIIYKTTKHYFG